MDTIKSALERLPNLGSISVLPDFFVDRFVRFESLDDLFVEMKSRSRNGGGGSIRGITQSEVKGGNAVNLAYSLGTFGANVNLIAIANSLPSEMLRSTFRSLRNVNLQLVEGAPGFTVAFEFKDTNRHVNVMLSDVGDLKDFDGSKISREQWTNIENSKILAVVNWSANRSGNALCKKAFSFAEERNAMTFFDPADITGQEDRLPEFKREIIDKGLINFMSLNENEARVMSSVLFNEKLPQNHTLDELKHILLKLADEIGAHVDLHTKKVSLTCHQNDITETQCFQVVQKTVTGAGDVWAAADIIGYLSNLDPSSRLAFANATAGLYVSRESAIPPTADEVLEFMSTYKI